MQKVCFLVLPRYLPNHLGRVEVVSVCLRDLTVTGLGPGLLSQEIILINGVFMKLCLLCVSTEGGELR